MQTEEEERKLHHNYISFHHQIQLWLSKKEKREKRKAEKEGEGEGEMRWMSRM